MFPPVIDSVFLAAKLYAFVTGGLLTCLGVLMVAERIRGVAVADSPAPLPDSKTTRPS
jgi:hypothetical protein